MNYKIDIKLDGLFGIILAVNIILKLLNIITWSWLIVLWPIWASIGIIFIIFIIFAIIRRKV